MQTYPGFMFFLFASGFGMGIAVALMVALSLSPATRPSASIFDRGVRPRAPKTKPVPPKGDSGVPRYWTPDPTRPGTPYPPPGRDR